MEDNTTKIEDSAAQVAEAVPEVKPAPVVEGFGDRLKMLRRSNGFTQEQLGTNIGVVPSAVGKYERGDIPYPSVEILLRISNFFKVSTDYLLKGVEAGSPGINHSFNNVSNQNGIIFGNRPSISPEGSELLNIYNALSGKDRIKVLSYVASIGTGDRAE